MSEIAVLITCFNRCKITIRCLKHLFELKNDVAVYLVDDNSTDGTSNTVSKQFPHVCIIKGNGNLFWSKGMHLAWKKAARKEYDYYLWLNDDVVFYENCFDELFECLKSVNEKSIIVGIIESEDKYETLYGGTNAKKQLIVPNGKMNPVTNMNGNVVLVPKSVYKILGNLDPAFHHDLGDVDYGLRARENGIPVFTTRIAIGSGEKNNFCRIRLSKSTLKYRLKKLYSPLGNHPAINFYFRRKHFGIFNAIGYYFFIHFINLLPDSVVNIIFGTKYL